MKKFLRYLLGPVVTEIADIRKEIRGLDEKLTIRDAIIDFFHVARNTGFVLIPAILAGAIFLSLPQGRDTLLLVVENMASGNFKQFSCFLAGIVLWSVFSELSVRYAIAIADNSGKSLRDSRVYFRKLCQRMLAGFCLVWPCIMVLFALLWCYNTAIYMTDNVKHEYFGIFAIAVIIILRLLIYLYFHKKKRVGNDPARTILGSRSLPPEEYLWINRLYGIYNEFVYSLVKPSNFRVPYAEDMKTFTDHVVNAPENFRDGFPQNMHVMVKLRLIPEPFKLLNPDSILSTTGDSYKWRYKIPTSFYKAFHIQVLLMAVLSVLLIIIFAFIPANCGFFGFVGAPALICIAFACYSGIYAGLLFIDYGWLRKNPLPIRAVLIALLLFSSYFNKDHPVRMDLKSVNPPRISLVNQFDAWFANYKREMDGQYPGNHRYPVFFVCAEGGALRTGAYTGLFLTQLQRELYCKGVDFKKSLFAMSGVSGGALGLSYYNAKGFESIHDTVSGKSDSLHVTRFFKYDELSPIVGKMLFGEFINLFIPWHIEGFDRAIALEVSWEEAYEDAMRGTHETNRFKENFIDCKRDTLKPVLVINTTEIESGYQCWISNIDPIGLTFQSKRDLLKNKVKRLNYSTAINFSTRFPIFSPGAEIDTIGDTVRGRFHYLDGGYVENTGAGSMLELVNILNNNAKLFKQVVPIVIFLRFSENYNTKVQNIRFANEVTEIISGIYDTRAGRSFTNVHQLDDFVNEQHGIIIDEPLSAKERDVPMNWVLSDQSMQNIANDIRIKLNDTSSHGIYPLLFSKGLNYYRTDPKSQEDCNQKNGK